MPQCKVNIKNHRADCPTLVRPKTLSFIIKVLYFQSSGQTNNCQVEVLFKWLDQSCTPFTSPESFKLLIAKKDWFLIDLINEELTKERDQPFIQHVFDTAMKIFFEVSISVLSKYLQVRLFYWNFRYVHFNEHLLHLTFVKIDHLKMVNICLPSKQGIVLKFVHVSLHKY